MAEAVPENLKARMKDSYDAIADIYASKFTKLDDPLRLGYLRTLCEHFQTDAKDVVNVLELGCGSGVPATKFMLLSEKPVVHITGNDISTAQINLARSNLAGYEERLTLSDGDMFALDFENETFDAVTGFYSIIHLPREEQTQLMHKVAGWLKPGSYFLANFTAEIMPAAEMHDWMGHEKGWVYWSGWGEEASVKMVEAAGFEILTKDAHQDVGDSKFLWILARKVES